jgi:DNA-binding IscR family transcriptional regulator
MSINAAIWARRHTISDRTAESILLAIADRADEGGRCIWSLKEIARCVSLSAREVREKIHWLRGFGLISSFRASDGYVFFLPINPKLHDLRGRGV